MLDGQGSTVWKLGILVVAGVTGYLSATAVTRGVPDQRREVAAPAWFTLRAKVTRIVDGDTLIARVSVRRSERVRLIGIDTPEVDRCYAAQATLTARKLALNRRVKLQGDRTQSRRDRFGRLLAYVLLPSGRDLGRELIRSGRGVVFVFSRPFAKLASYRAAEAAARSARLGLSGAPASHRRQRQPRRPQRPRRQRVRARRPQPLRRQARRPLLHRTAHPPTRTCAFRHHRQTSTAATFPTGTSVSSTPFPIPTLIALTAITTESAARRKRRQV
jgi:endonuclease YncB( thermonuclease family)